MWGWRPVSGKKMESKDFDAKQKKNISTQIVCFIQLIPDRLQIKKKITRIIGRRNNETQTRRQEQRRNSRKAFKKKNQK
jgi:hypothetical protein